MARLTLFNMEDETLGPDVPEPKKVTELTPEQEQKMITFWNSRAPNYYPSLKEMTVHLFGEGFDGRSNEAKATQRALGKHSYRAKTTSVYEKKTDEIELTEHHKEYIKNNVATMSGLEMAKTIFANPKLSNLNAEARAVINHIKTLNPKVLFDADEVNEVPDEYKPPETFDQTLARIHTYVAYVPDRKKITASQSKTIDMLQAYLHTFRFINQMNTYDTVTDRKICEDAFIRATYDKPDLMQEEIDQYIEYANHVVQGFNIQRRSIRLQKILEEISGNDPETMKISMGLVEAIGKASTEYNLCKKREADLLDDLKVQRSDRLANEISDKASILNLVQMWKTEEGRAELNRHAEKEQAAIAKEVDHLSSLPEIKARIMGLSKDKIKYG
jgi:hypothetical protein